MKDEIETTIQFLARSDYEHSETYAVMEKCENCLDRKSHTIVVTSIGTPFFLCKMCFDELKQMEVKK